jgi:hypothetical protein
MEEQIAEPGEAVEAVDRSDQPAELEGTYTVEVGCSNCGRGMTLTGGWTVDIARGSPVAEEPCPECGCRQLSRRGSRP